MRLSGSPRLVSDGLNEGERSEGQFRRRSRTSPKSEVCFSGLPLILKDPPEGKVERKRYKNHPNSQPENYHSEYLS